MSFPIALFAKFGMFAHKDDQDFFDMRLARTRIREERRAARAFVFKSLLSHSAA